MQSAARGCHAPAGLSSSLLRSRTYVPPCAPSSSGRVVGSRHITARAAGGKGGGKDDKAKEKADFSALWALRIKNFFSSRRKYLQQAEQVGDDDKEKAFKAEIAKEERSIRELKDELVAISMEEIEEQEKQGDPRPALAATDIAQARMDLQTSPLTRAVLAVVRVRELLRALLLLPFSAVGGAVAAWQGLFNSQRYENFLMSEGERIWAWRNRSENERWFWEVFAWDRLIFPILVIVAWEYLVPNHLVWAVLAPLALLTWMSGRLPTPATPEFWMLAYFGFYRKVWPDAAAWLQGYVVPLMGFA
ncbi:hypothetical protein CHLRE_13g566250v5 [Chlamydomonas reinhardtii]|uniref:Uncharacterized protein n=1 Tax=Chlamydomonas reinhardtii TaxID=3055 RepID=A0A2K3CZ99_CHLRE|nr:uncharacterized protein CHLRE_13g566250v5 [Chlamydomonas reinhardtii]PNW73624.1 hypothetical protein CHLRE_13g566250v5 [Chlamydomonas reinhardtii]